MPTNISEEYIYDIQLLYTCIQFRPYPFINIDQYFDYLLNKMFM